MTNYPEHEKMEEIKDESQLIGAFLSWLNHETDIQLAVRKWRLQVDGYTPFDELPDHVEGPPPYTGDQLVVYHIKIEELLAEYFDIDLETINEEKEQMLEEMRAMQEAN